MVTIRPKPPEVVSMAEAARILGVSEKTIQRLVVRRKGGLKSVKIGRRRLIPYVEIKKLLEGAK